MGRVVVNTKYCDKSPQDLSCDNILSNSDSIVTQCLPLGFSDLEKYWNIFM